MLACVGVCRFTLRPPLEGPQRRLYEMILQRTLASVMVDAVLDLTTLDVAARTQVLHIYIYSMC